MQTLHVSTRVVDAGVYVRLREDYLNPLLYVTVLSVVSPTQRFEQLLLAGVPDSFLVPLLSDGDYQLGVTVSDLDGALVAQSAVIQLHYSYFARKRLRRMQQAWFAGSASHYRRNHLLLDQALFESALGNPHGFTHYLH
jgi:hypothetical protein